MTQFLELQRGYQQLQIMPVGIPGSGKSTCLKIMQQLIPGARRLNQDECQKSSKIYHRTLAKLSRDPKIPVLLMDKCNHNRQVRAGTYNTIHRQTLIHIIFYHPNDIDPGDLVGAEEMPLTHALKLATERILSRGLGHANLYPSFELAKIMNGFTKSFELPDLNEIDPGAGIMLMDMTWAPLTMAERLMDWLREKNLLHAPPVSSREMEMALHNVTTEEGALAHKNESKAKVQSWVAHVLDPGPIYTDPLISQILAERQFPPKSELHLTLYYQGVNQSFDPRVLGPYNGSMVDLEITHVAYDDKAVALRVQSSIPCQNKHPHLTVAHRPDTASVYSNTLLMDPPFEYPLAIRVPARVVRYCKT
jgi:tRNA splicing ligase